jgi:hypothetical protein
VRVRLGFACWKGDLGVCVLLRSQNGSSEMFETPGAEKVEASVDFHMGYVLFWQSS